MQAANGSETFRPGEIVVFSGSAEVNSGDYAFVQLPDGSTFRRVVMPDPEHLRLVPLNPAHQELVVSRSEVKHMWKLVRHMRRF